MAALRLGVRACAVRRVGRCALATRAADDDVGASPRPAVVSRYPGHLPTSPLQKVAAAAASAVLALRDPTRADMVGTLGEVTGARALARIRDGLRGTAAGRRVLAERPTVGSAGPADAARLRAECAPGTFGRAYGEFMARHGFDADDRSPVALVDDEELAYVLLRYRQSHDFWHVLCGLPPTLAGEVALKWFEVAHLGLPVALVSALLGPLHMDAAERRFLRRAQIPWALRAGAACAPLLAASYEDHWHDDLAAFRAALRLEVAPTMG